jgi:hypothetical protein
MQQVKAPSCIAAKEIFVFVLLWQNVSLVFGILCQLARL